MGCLYLQFKILFKMKISYNWLKQFIKLDWDAEKTGDLLTDLGLEVEGIDSFQSVKGGLQGIVVGHVVSCEKHPNADKLNLTKIDLGTGEPVQIVCGAPNIATGQKVPVATIGTVLYDDKGADFKIKKGKIRGEESFGMVCSEVELGLGTDASGIMVLDNSLTPGTPCAEVFNIELDEVFEIGLTPNRSDAMSHFGVARDLKAGLIQQNINLELITPSVSDFYIENRTQKIEIEVENPKITPRYCGVTLSDIKVTDSPLWLQNRLKAIGLTPKNNIVDATNYVLHELGQPLHAFDISKIKGHKIQVKNATPGEKFITLDGVERELHADDLMIYDAEKPMCIAGVLGGLDSGVTEYTTAIFLESAYFNPVAIRKTAKRHALNTDASFRFERGIDPNTVQYALKRAALLIQEIAGGYVSSNIEDFYPTKIEDFQVALSFDYTTKLIGQEIPKETIKSILTSLDIKINNVTETSLGLTIPAYRNDVTREADVVEEILRVYGYNNIEYSNKLNATMSHSPKFEDYKIQNIVANQLMGQGFNEIMANSLTTPKYATLSEQLKEEHNVTLLNPLSADLAVMRQSLLFSGLEAVSYNLNRKQNNLQFFEFGKTYHKFESGYQENKHLTLFTTGNRTQNSWINTAKKTDFFYLKAIVENILTRLGVSKLKTSPIKTDVLSEGISFSLGKMNLVTFGIVKRNILKSFGINQEVVFADFNWDNVLEVAKFNKTKFTAIPKYPEVKRDFALLVDQEVTFKEIYNLAQQSERKLLTNVNLFDVYEGDKLPKGKKSYAVSFTLQDENKTLTDKQIDKIMTKLQTTFEKQLNAELR